MDRSALFLAPLRVCVGNLFAKAPGRKFTNLEKQYRSKLNTIFRYSIVTFGLAVISISVFFVHSYRSYARIVHARLARGYLTSRGGIYAAPRILRVGQKYSREDLVAVLRRAGYVEMSNASEVWNGSFTLENDEVVVRTNAPS